MKGSKKKSKRPAKGALMILALILVSSAVIRVVAGADQAIAKEKEPEIAQVGQPTPLQCEPDPKLRPLLDALKRREANLQEQENEIRVRMQALAVADREIEKRMSELVAAEESLRATLTLADSAAEDDIARLTTVYENMKPKDAAALFGTMDPEFAAGFLGRMRPENAAGIMSGLDPAAAYTISVVLAGRNANVPKK